MLAFTPVGSERLLKTSPDLCLRLTHLGQCLTVLGHGRKQPRNGENLCLVVDGGGVVSGQHPVQFLETFGEIGQVPEAYLVSHLTYRG